MNSIQSFFRTLVRMTELRYILFGISPEKRAEDRKRRQDIIRHMRRTMINDLLNRHKAGDFTIFQEDLNRLHQLKKIPILKKIEEIHRKYT